MRRRDWAILLVLLILAGWFGSDRLREAPIGRYLAGECEWRGGRVRGGGCTAPRSDGPYR